MDFRCAYSVHGIDNEPHMRPGCILGAKHLRYVQTIHKPLEEMLSFSNFYRSRTYYEGRQCFQSGLSF